MAPIPKNAKSAKTVKAGSDLRMFFGPGGSQPRILPKARPHANSGSENTFSSGNKPDGRQFKSRSQEVMAIVGDDDEQILHKPKNTVIALSSDEEGPQNVKTTLKRKVPTVVSSDEEDTPRKKPALISRSPAKPRLSTTQPKSKKQNDDEDFDMESVASETSDQNLIQNKSVKRKPVKKGATGSKVEKGAPVVPSKVNETTGKVPQKKFDWAAKKAARLAGPVAHGSKEVPDGVPDALLGLSFVFTGELSSFSREEATDLAKRFGGRVVLQPSSKTDFVVLGADAGPSKLAAINKHGIKTLSEDEFLNLIGTRKGLGKGKVDVKTRKKLEKENEEIKKAARDLETRERQNDLEAKGNSKAVDPSTRLWTARYAPQNLKEICGNKGHVEKLQQWLHDWDTSLKSGFKKPGKNGMNIFRAVLITGSPGIGKTTSAHLCAKLEGFTPIELNASDTRSKKLVENGMNINNTSLDGFVKGANATNSLGVTITDKTCLIMDEVDGMSAGDRGGVGALNALIKKSKIPIICIANDRQAQKLKPLMGTTFSLPFQKPPAQAIRSRILTVAFREKLEIPSNVIDQLINGAQSDIRQVLNMLSTWKLSHDSMDFDEGKNLAKLNEKHSIMSPFDITSRLLGPYMFSATSSQSLADKMEHYFQDHSFIPLFIQENYLKTQPAKLKNLDGPEKQLKELELMDRAASSISDGDLVDATIHSPEQHWSLMPFHAICSTVKPASYFYGSGLHYGGPNGMSFPQWLGQNSKQNKLSRQLGEVQIRMRLKVSGDKAEIRQLYIPALFPHIVKPLLDVGASAVGEVIEMMDKYYLSKEDWDTIVELGVDQNKDDVILKKISAATKTSLTKKYNSTEHPIPFHKATDLGKVPKKLAGGPVPDIEEAYVDDEIEEVSEDESKSKSSDDAIKDTLIKVPKKKGKPLAK